MKALVLSGGKGTRLRPITHTSAKQLVPVANKPILYYAIEAIRDAGITEIGIIVGETHEEIRAACNDGSDWGCKITYIPQDAPLGLAHAVKIAEPFIGKDSGSYNAQILLAHVRNPKQFGVAELDPKTGGVVKLEEKPAKPKTDLALVGVYMFDSSVFTAVNAIKPSTRGELEITEAIQYLIDNDYSVHSHVIEGYWKDTGRLEDMLEANRIILDGLTRKIEGTVDGDSQIIGKVHIESGAKIIDSVVRGPAIIGKDTVIENAYIGPFTSIYHDCVISGSEVEHSIILEGSKIENVGVRIEDSLIGKNVKVGKTDQKPIAYRFMLGDNSEVSIV
jgi:glucose-1-phosphate thymidylyltransferase